MHFQEYFAYYFRQANVSSVYRKLPVTNPDNEQIGKMETDDMLMDNKPGPSHFSKDTRHFNPVQAIKEIKKPQLQEFDTKPYDSVPKSNVPQSTNNQDVPMEARNTESIDRAGHNRPVKIFDDSCSSTSTQETQDQLERRLKIEEEVTFVSS